MLVDLNFRRRKILKACSGRDRISRLSDDVLLHVLSSLSLKEAGRTGVLSNRWRHVWSYMPTLNFDSCYISHEISVAREAVKVERSWHIPLETEKLRYVHWVDQVLSSHNAPVVEEFRVQYHLRADNKKSVDDWVRFAMLKGVKRLSMDLALTNGDFPSLNWAFPSTSLRSSLISLELAGVNVTGEAIQDFLYNCRALEFLYVNYSKALVDLKVVGRSLNLKYLLIHKCGIKHLEISAPNLVHFSYYGPKISVPFRNTPKLVEISVGGRYAVNLSNNFFDHSSYLSQLEGLMLDMFDKTIMKSVQIPELTRLKKLEVRVEPWPGQNLFCLKRLVNACPFLQRFVLQLEPIEYIRKPIRERIDFPHNHLKVVEIVGYDGYATCFEFAIWLLDIAVSLEKIIVDPRLPLQIGIPTEFDKCKMKRAKAKLLRAYLKPHTDLVII